MLMRYKCYATSVICLYGKVQYVYMGELPISFSELDTQSVFFETSILF